MNNSGYTKAWFSWLEWLTLSAAFIAGGIKSGFWLVAGIGLFSAILLYNHTIQSTTTALGDYLYERKLPKVLAWVVAIFVSALFPLMLFIFLTMAIFSLLNLS